MQLQMDMVIELLEDGKWHKIQTISQKSKLNEFKIEILTDFLADYSFLEFNKSEKKARLSKIFAEFLRKTRRMRRATLT